MSMKWLTENLSLHKVRYKNILLILIGSLLLLASGCSLLPDENVEETLPAITPPKLSKKPEYLVKTDTIESKVNGIGKLMSTKEEALFFIEANKRIHNIHVSVGDQVQEGQLIAELDVTDLNNQLRQARLQLRSDELKMIQTLRKADEMSAEELEQAKIAFELKRTNLLELEESISRSKLTAPISGTIVSVSMNKGDVSTAYETVAVIADLKQLTVAVKISKSDLEKIAVGMETIVSINSAGQHKGEVKQLPVEDSGNNNDPWNNPPPKDSVENYVIIGLDPFPAELNRGTPLSASIIVQRKENVVVIPPSVLRTHVGRSYVQVIDEEGNRREVDVEVGQQTSTLVEIVKGLEPGQKVVGR
jgi:macrolide-specific efflux system membrane fusion protein